MTENAGIREENGEIICKPNLPEKWNGMRFKLIYKNILYVKNNSGMMIIT
ncbi:glycosyl hydrolase family 65 protein [Sharpea porci]